jgi:hypothetical protein
MLLLAILGSFFVLTVGDCECYGHTITCHGYFDGISMKYACPENDVITTLIIYNPLVSQFVSLSILENNHLGF